MTERTLSTSLRDIEYLIFYRPADKPLQTFYLPTLAASVHYDRSAGYFRSSALAAAAAGIVRLIQNNGHMRLLVGAELSTDDVEAIKQGYELRNVVGQAMLGQFPEPTDGQLAQRLAALTWMVANGTLDIKVVLPLDSAGFPIPGPETHDYYHTKKGIFTDRDGNQVGFIGSVNESAQAWKENFEEFVVYSSWESDHSSAALAQLHLSFDDLWEGRDPNWVAIDLPEAVRQELIRRAPSQPPEQDPLEPQPLPQISEPPAAISLITQAERLRFQFLRDAPFLPGAQHLGAITSAITLKPHQVQVMQTLIDRFPDRAMLCDEVGLGKTIEAGVVIRQLLISGRVKRCLILAPASVQRQWQEELEEKFNLSFLRYHQRQLFDWQDQPIGPPIDNPWHAQPLLIASSQLAKRRQRVAQLASAPAWDLLVVDEAHHARRKDFLQNIYRPNRLLTLLNKLRENRRFQGLLLLTATPMQVHPVEMWDLLSVLGLGGRWGADERAFLDFFGELRKPPLDADWDFVFDLVREALETPGAPPIDEHFRTAMGNALGAAHANMICELPYRGGRRNPVIRQLPTQALPYVREMARRHTPLRRYVSRNTREQLRQYVAKGLSQDKVPRRKPTIRRISFLPEEADLYQRITEYISEFYRKYEAERKGLGFIMTVYRRRLTSSFFAVQRSLERRRDWLRGQLGLTEALSIEDEADLDELEELEQEGLDVYGVDEEREYTPAQVAYFRAELNYLDSFIGDLQALSHSDSKTNELIDDLARIFTRRPKVMIFTQYTDTMDYLREQLQEVYRGAIACYSGRGGEVWNGIKWVVTTKESVKQQFWAGQVKILLCTESASEGLNMHTCGVLINYDMPWNPMRVEQRIGRIDRIGQTYDFVWVNNYFYQDTIEDRIYQALKDRINWFEDVVGNLQPILADVNDVTRKLAMLPAEEQEERFQQEIHRLRDEIERLSMEALNLDEYAAQGEPHTMLHAPVTLADLEQALTTSPATRHRFSLHETIPRAYWLTFDGTPLAVTFNAACYDEHPDSVHFLTYGSPVLSALLASVPAPEAWPPQLARFSHDNELLPVCGWYDLVGAAPKPIGDLVQLARLLEATTAPLSSADDAGHRFAATVAETIRVYNEHVDQLEKIERSTVQARARRLLEQAALVEIALGSQQGLFEQGGYPSSFSDAAVANLQRHKSPWSWLLVAAGGPLPGLSEDDPYWAEIHQASREQLVARFQSLAAEAKEVVETYRH